jgi:hypothetical protein
VAAHTKLALSASAAFATLAIMFAAATGYAWDGEKSANETHPCPEAPLNIDATARAPLGSMISQMDADDAFGCQHLDQARKAGPLDQLREVDLRSGECTRFARGEHVYMLHTVGTSPQTDPDGRRVAPSLYAVQRVGGGPTYYVVGEANRE